MDRRITINVNILTLDRLYGGNLGVYIDAGGSAFNGQAGTITGGDGVRFNNGLGTLTNFGKIISVTALTGLGVELHGGRVVNGAATVTGASIVGARGLEVYGAAGTVTNFGTIAAGYTNASAIRLHAGGVIANQPSGLVQGTGDGITIGGAGIGAGTVTNSGTIVGTFFLESETSWQGFIRTDDGTFTPIDPDGSGDVWVAAINNKGVFAGAYLGSDGLQHGFIGTP